MATAAAAAVLIAAPALAQTASSPPSDRASHIAPGASTVAPNLPTPDVGPNAGPAAFLTAAQNAIAAGRTGEAQQALEMAQTRLLDRSVAIGTTGVPSDDPAVRATSAALHALGNGDKAASLDQIRIAIQAAGPGR